MSSSARLRMNCERQFHVSPEGAVLSFTGLPLKARMRIDKSSKKMYASTAFGSPTKQSGVAFCRKIDFVVENFH